MKSSAPENVWATGSQIFTFMTKVFMLILILGGNALLNLPHSQAMESVPLTLAEQCPLFVGIYYCPNSEHYVASQFTQNQPTYSCSSLQKYARKHPITAALPPSTIHSSGIHSSGINSSGINSSGINFDMSSAYCFLNEKRIKTVSIRCVNPIQQANTESFSLTVDDLQRVFEVEMTVFDYLDKSFRYQASYPTPCHRVH